jgi:tetratricopeptide (TPR) repeat protein
MTEFKAKQFQESLASAQQALRLRPDLPEAYNNMCVAYIELHQYDKAIEAAQNSLRLRPDYILAKNNMAWAVAEKQKAGLGKKQ